MIKMVNKMETIFKRAMVCLFVCCVLIIKFVVLYFLKKNWLKILMKIMEESMGDTCLLRKKRGYGNNDMKK